MKGRSYEGQKPIKTRFLLISICSLLPLCVHYAFQGFHKIEKSHEVNFKLDFASFKFLLRLSEVSFYLKKKRNNNTQFKRGLSKLLWHAVTFLLFSYIGKFFNY